MTQNQLGYIVDYDCARDPRDMPRSPMRLRADDPWLGSCGDRLTDGEWFDENRSAAWRLSGATAGDARRAGLDTCADDERPVRTARLARRLPGLTRDGYPKSEVRTLVLLESQSGLLNDLTDEELTDLWKQLSANSWAVLGALEIWASELQKVRS